MSVYRVRSPQSWGSEPLPETVIHAHHFVVDPDDNNLWFYDSDDSEIACFSAWVAVIQDA